MVTKAKSVEVPFIDRGDGHVAIGGRDMTQDQVDAWNRQASGMAPAGAVNPPTAPQAPGVSLPFAHVARQAIGREVQAFRAAAERAEAELAAVPFTNEVGHPYVVQRREDMRRSVEGARAEIERLLSMTDLEARQWAFDRGYR